MGDWVVSERDVKRYPHFDKFLAPKEIEAIVRDPDRVRTNKFYPLLRYPKEFRPFRLTDKPKKTRLIRYASRRDSAIFSYYRHILSERYELELIRLGLSDTVLAYRKILGRDNRGKCNIHFARDAFDFIVTTGDCCAVALDISSYFESIDHARLKALWCRMLGVTRLPPDHHAVFKNITEYAFVERQAAYERLGYFGVDAELGRPGYLVPFEEMPMQLCTPAEFRERIVGGAPDFPNLVQKNEGAYGIPQGAPISDLLANLYLLDFDIEMHDYAKAASGVYKRYSDDILFVVPGGAEEGSRARQFAMERIQAFGSKLRIKAEKSSVVRFFGGMTGAQQFEHLDGKQGRNGLEYLGFRFDGRQVFLRDSTVSGFYRKISLAARAAAYKHVARYEGKSIDYLVERFNVEEFTKKFGRVEDFEDDGDYRSWTFWTYARRAAEAFGSLGQPILRQVKNHDEVIAERVVAALEQALRKSKNDAGS